jgi:hypothetical protein
VKRRVRVILTYLFLGAILNAAVAWGIVLMHGYVTLPLVLIQNPRPHEDAMLHRWRMSGHEVLISYGPFTDTWTPEEKATLPADQAPWWPNGILKRDSQHTFPAVIASGWPCLTLCTWTNTELDRDFQWGLKWEPEYLGYERAMESLDAYVPLIFPLRPLLRGWLINTPFYAGVAWFAVASARSFRAWLRSRKGLCPRCAYPRENHAVCPECGTAHRRTMRKRVAHTMPPA